MIIVVEISFNSTFSRLLFADVIHKKTPDEGASPNPFTIAKRSPLDQSFALIVVLDSGP